MVTVDLHAPFVSRLAPRSRQDSEVVPVRPLPILVDIARRNETAPVCDLHVFLLLRSLDRCWCEFGNRGRISPRKGHLDAWFPITPLERSRFRVYHLTGRLRCPRSLFAPVTRSS